MLLPNVAYVSCSHYTTSVTECVTLARVCEKRFLLPKTYVIGVNTTKLVITSKIGYN